MNGEGAKVELGRSTFCLGLSREEETGIEMGVETVGTRRYASFSGTFFF